ncbi:MAG: type II toxin-antitoxin system RelE/ParE family toxin [Actinobacteria bacterium]|nr:type II toxin-antitoxin system RelE/ParE family toxin [Actinomycetota bacterium]MBU4240580.1 type II toxin-antitoxin system RelE/ParE family toxin [Actinomycetota bacterium]MBU4489231.1 type II toxin-antitoxin system RelE/ParE family toxin [Actinomycetota bacterium]
MSEWKVSVSHEAASTLRRLDRTNQKRMKKAIDRLALEPTPGPGRDIRPIRGVEGLLRLRVGGWRILFTVDKQSKRIFILAVRPRGQAYRNM